MINKIIPWVAITLIVSTLSVFVPLPSGKYADKMTPVQKFGVAFAASALVGGTQILRESKKTNQSQTEKLTVMDKYTYTDEEYREEDGDMVKYVFVPLEGEWMDMETFYFNKGMWEDAMDDARDVWDEHGSDW